MTAGTGGRRAWIEPAIARLAVLSELRRRIETIETRPPAPTPRLPPHDVVAGEAPGALRLEQLTGAVREDDGVLVVRTTIPPDARVGRVAPADAFVASPEVAAHVAGLDRAPADLLHGMRLLDIETTGLAGGTGTLAFLVGVARFEPDGTLLVEQLILGSPGEESRLIARLERMLEGATLLVTFNGRSFDVPLLRTRSILSRRPPRALTRLPHLDLLGISRRLWRGRAPDCRLVTLEDRILGRRRLEDVPGSFAPAAYASFLADGDARVLSGIVDHNRDDIVGMTALLAAALRTLESPETWAEDASELGAVAGERLRRGESDQAISLLERGLQLARAPETRRRLLTQLARAHRSSGCVDGARRAWERYRADFPRESLGYVELAKILEHRVRDPVAALAVARAAPHPGGVDLSRRLTRLTRRVARLG